MPSWKKVITSGSDACLNSLYVTNAITSSGAFFTGSVTIDSSGSTLLDIQGSQGQLFSVTDSLSGSLMSVNDISGLPILEVFSDDTVIMGEYGSNALVVTGSNVGIGTASPSSRLEVCGDITVTGSQYISGSIQDVHYIDFDTNVSVDTPYKEGRLFYNNEEGALTFYNNEADSSLQIGQEFWVRVYNDTGTQIDNGTPVRLSGSQGDKPKAYPAIAEDHTTGAVLENHIIGIATHDIGIGEEGYVTEQGVVRGVDTQAFDAGDILWLQTGSAGFRNTPPPFPYDIVQVGYVTRAASNGFIFVSPKEPVHFDDISGLSGSADSQGALWMYNACNNSFTPRTGLSGSYSITGSLSVTPTDTQAIGISRNDANLGASFAIEQNGSGDALMQFSIPGANLWNVGIDNSNGDALTFARGTFGTGLETMTLKSSNVGIGTTDPGCTLSVVGAICSSDQIRASTMVATTFTGNLAGNATTADVACCSDKIYAEQTVNGVCSYGILLALSGSESYNTVTWRPEDLYYNPAGALVIGCNFCATGKFTGNICGQAATAVTASVACCVNVKECDSDSNFAMVYASTVGGVAEILGTTDGNKPTYNPDAAVFTVGSICALSSICGNFCGEAATAVTAETANCIGGTPAACVVYVCGNQTIGGLKTFSEDVTVEGTLTAREFKTELVSASILYQSGSTKFGDTSDDVHQFTGSLLATGSIGVNRTAASGFALNTLGSVLIQAPDGNCTQLELRNPVNSDRGIRIVGTGTSSGASATFDIVGFGPGAVLRPAMSWKPVSNLTYDLGSSSDIWRTTYTQTVKGRNNTSQGILCLSSGTSSNPVTINIDTTEYMRVNNDGNVGIGTTSPGAKLDVRGSAVFNEDSADVDFRVESNGNANMLFVDGGNDRVGIGTNSPTQTLQITGTTLVSHNTNGLSGSLFVGAVPTSHPFPLDAGYTLKNGLVAFANPSENCLPTLRNYGSAGIIGSSAGATGGRLNIGVFGYSRFSQDMSTNTGNLGVGGYFLAKGVGGTTDFKGSYTGVYGEGNIGTDTVASPYGCIRGGHFVATGTTNQATYGVLVSATGGSTNYGIYSENGTNYFNGDVGIGTTTPGCTLSVVGAICSSDEIRGARIKTAGTLCSSTTIVGANICATSCFIGNFCGNATSATSAGNSNCIGGTPAACVVYVCGNQAISGVKSFSSCIVGTSGFCGVASNAIDSNKIGGTPAACVIFNCGNQTVGGVKSFSDCLMINGGAFATGSFMPVESNKMCLGDSACGFHTVFTGIVTAADEGGLGTLTLCGNSVKGDIICANDYFCGNFCGEAATAVTASVACCVNVKECDGNANYNVVYASTVGGDGKILGTTDGNGPTFNPTSGLFAVGSICTLNSICGNFCGEAATAVTAGNANCIGGTPAACVVYVCGNQTVGGVKTFSSCFMYDNGSVTNPVVIGNAAGGLSAYGIISMNGCTTFPGGAGFFGGGGGNNCARANLFFVGHCLDFRTDMTCGCANLQLSPSLSVFNPSQKDTDFRVDTVGEVHTVFVNASNQRVGIGTGSPAYKLDVNGSFAATSKSFVIDNPVKGGKLRYGSLEGPEHGVYVRGYTTDKVIELPEDWLWLIDEDSITVQLTPVKSFSTHAVIEIKENKVYIDSETGLIDCYFFIQAERKDVDKLVTHIDE